MTSRQVMLTALCALLALGSALGVGCDSFQGRGQKPQLASPHPGTHVWAVVPLGNESGSRAVDTLRLSDKLTAHLERVAGVDTLPLNRVLAEMDAMGVPAVTGVHEALALRRRLNVEGLVVGTVSAYDPYDPPKLGLIVELYLGGVEPIRGVDIRHLSRAAVDQDARLHRDPIDGPTQPVSRVSAYFDAADPRTRRALDAYGKQHSVTRADPTRVGIFTEHDPIGPRLYRLSTDLYGDFATFQVVRQLLDAEAQRLAPYLRHQPLATDNPDPSPDG